MTLSNAERQRRYRERRKAQVSVVRYRRPVDRRSRPKRWWDAVETLHDLQGEYQAWLDNLPESLQGSILAEKLEEVCAIATWMPWISTCREALDATEENPAAVLITFTSFEDHLLFSAESSSISKGHYDDRIVTC